MRRRIKAFRGFESHPHRHRTARSARRERRSRPTQQPAHRHTCAALCWATPERKNSPLCGAVSGSRAGSGRQPLNAWACPSRPRQGGPQPATGTATDSPPRPTGTAATGPDFGLFKGMLGPDHHPWSWSLWKMLTPVCKALVRERRPPSRAERYPEAGEVYQRRAQKERGALAPPPPPLVTGAHAICVRVRHRPLVTSAAKACPGFQTSAASQQTSRSNSRTPDPPCC